MATITTDIPVDYGIIDARVGGARFPRVHLFWDFCPPPPSAPAIQITSPTTLATYDTVIDSINVSGISGDDVGVVLVHWVNDRGGSGDATGLTTWSVTGIFLQPGVNTLTFTAYDAEGNTGTDILVVTYAAPPPPVETTTSQNRAICLNLASGAVTPHTFAVPYSAGIQYISQHTLTIDGLAAVSGTIDGLAALYATIDSMGAQASPTSVLGGNSGEVDQFGISTQDAGEMDISWSITLPWQRPNASGDVYVDGVTVYWTKEPESTPITITVTPTKSLGGADVGTSVTVDLEHDEEHFVPFPNMRGRWIKVTISGDHATATMRLHLSELYAWPRGTRVRGG